MAAFLMKVAEEFCRERDAEEKSLRGIFLEALNNYEKVV